MCLPFRHDDQDLRTDMQIFQSTAAAIFVAIVVSACTPAQTPPALSGIPTGVDVSHPSEASTPEPDSAETAKPKAVDAYKGMWRAIAEAATTSDWQSPAIARFATGEALTVITNSLSTDRANGVVTRGTPRTSPIAVTAVPADAPTVVMISDCGDSTDWLKYRVDGGLADDVPGGRRSITAEVKRQAGGSWKVTRFAVSGLGSC